MNRLTRPDPERLKAPPQGTHICGGSWEKMPEASRREVWDFHDYLSDGGKREHGDFKSWKAARPLPESRE